MDDITQDVYYSRVANLLRTLHSFNILTEVIVTIISDEMNVNAKDICAKEGITYRI